MNRFKPPPQSEKQVKAAIRDMLRKLGIFHYNAWQGMFSEPGVSDLIGCLDGGRMFCIEVKKEKWSPPGPEAKSYDRHINQVGFIEKVRAAGGIGFFAQSVDEVIDGLGLRDRFLF